MRVYPVAIEIIRAPKKDDVVPLSNPIVGVSGRVYKELPVPAGTVIHLSTFGYNLCVSSSQSALEIGRQRLKLVSLRYRNKDLWGPDAYEFRPERWLEMNGKPESHVGVYGNLYVSCFYVHCLYRGLRSIEIALRSPEVTGVASGGDSRKSPAVLCHKALNRNEKKADHINSVIEMHTFLVTLIRQFDFSLPDNGQEVRKMRPGVLTPVVAGEECKGPRLFLKVTALKDE